MLALARLPLRSKILLIQVATVLLVVSLGSLASINVLARVVEQQSGDRVLGVAHTVALMPAIRQAFDAPDPSAVIQPLAEAVRVRTGVTFVVVANRDQVRYSHPVPARIGQLLSTDGQLALDGTPVVTAETGTLGRSIRAKVPILDDDGQIIGMVSVGILQDRLEDLLKSYWPQIAASALAALLLGLGISFGLASHVKRQIFGLEPAEIAALLEQREAMLHGIREGVVAIDRRGMVTVANDEARRLLDLNGQVEGRPVADVLPDAELLDVVATETPQEDRLALVNGRVLVVNRMPVRLRGQLVGAIATFRDRTEVQQLTQELDGTRSHLEALRAQAHEFANRLHTISGLIELGWAERAVALINQTTQQQQALIEELPGRLGDPSLAALLVGKASVASERGITFSVAADSRLEPLGGAGPDLVTIVGNLVENAFEAIEGRARRQVNVRLRDEHDEAVIEVRDSGPGVSAEDLPHIFEDGFSTKLPARGPRGIGLALVRRSVERLGGVVVVSNEGGAVFTVRVPRLAVARSRAARPRTARTGATR